MAGHDETVIEIDWREVARTAFSSAVLAGIVSGALRVMTMLLDARAADETPADEESVDQVAEAAALLGVDSDASADEIRAALRLRLAATRVHPDQGGDEEEAKRLIAAKNLLVERARARSGG